MKNKAPLALMELTVMILIFSLAAALCLQAFAWSEQTSVKIQERDQAMLRAETAAEVVKACRGDFAEAAELLEGEYQPEEDVLYVYLDGGDCLTAVREESGNPLLGRAAVTVCGGQEEVLFSIPVCWQEVKADEE